MERGMKVETDVPEQGLLRVRLCDEQGETQEEWFINDAKATMDMVEYQQKILWMEHRIRSFAKSAPRPEGYSLDHMPIRF